MIEVIKINRFGEVTLAIDGRAIDRRKGKNIIYTMLLPNSEVRIYDIKLSQKVASHRFTELPAEITKFDLYTKYEYFPEREIYVNVEVSANGDAAQGYDLFLTIRFYLPDWRQPFSIVEYVEELNSILKQEGHTFRSTSYAADGVSIFFPVEDKELTIEAVALKQKDNLLELHRKTITSLGSVIQQDKRFERIVRSIEFPPEYYQSGITILSYFTEVLRHKNLSEQVKVSIEQSGRKVRLVIESPTGQREEVERTLETYALVVAGKQPIDTLTTDPYEVMELKSQLRIASAQIENQRDMLALKNSEVTNLRSEVEENRASLKRLEQRTDDDRARFMSLVERLVLHNADLASGFRELTEQAAKFQNKALADALGRLYRVIERGVREEDQEEVICNLTTIQQQDPSVFRHVYDVLLMGSISGAAGNYLYSWLQIFVSSLHK